MMTPAGATDGGPGCHSGERNSVSALSEITTRFNYT